MNHLLIFTFCNNKDYNLKVIKIFLFIFSFSLNLTINTFFFNDETLHKIYNDKGNFNFIYQLPQIIYSTLISTGINIIINKLALSENNILELKKEKNKNELDKLKKSLLLKLKIKFFFSLFYLFSFFLYFVFLLLAFVVYIKIRKCI